MRCEEEAREEPRKRGGARAEDSDGALRQEHQGRCNTRRSCAVVRVRQAEPVRRQRAEGQPEAETDASGTGKHAAEHMRTDAKRQASGAWVRGPGGSQEELIREKPRATEAKAKEAWERSRGTGAPERSGLTGGNGGGDHLYPSRTQKLSPSAPMVLGGKLPGRAGRCRFSNKDTPCSRRECLIVF